MISKQLIRSSLRSIRATTTQPTSASYISLLPLRSTLRSAQSTQFDATPIRWLTSSSIRADEPSDPSQQAQVQTTPEQSQQQPKTEELYALYLSNLSFSITEELLADFISQHSPVPVKKVDVVRALDGSPRGFAFAKFVTQAEADAALSAINGLDFLGRQIVAAASVRRPIISSATNQLFMSGFPTDGEADEPSLRSVLQNVLGIQPKVIRFHKFPGGFLKGTGHIEFEDESMAEAALAKIQALGPDQPILVNGHPLTLVKARPLLQSRTRARGGFPAGRGGYGGPQGGYGGPQGGYGGPQGGYGGPQDGYGGPAGGFGAPSSYGGGYNAGYPSAGGYGTPPPYGRGSGGNNSGGTPPPY